MSAVAAAAGITGPVTAGRGDLLGAPPAAGPVGSTTSGMKGTLSVG